MKIHKDQCIRWLMLLIFLVISVVCFCYVTHVSVENIIVEGNSIYTDEEVAELIFSEEEDVNMLRTLYRVRTGYQKQIPFMMKYDMEVIGLNTVKVTVYEKQIIGCIVYMSNYLYFDRDGMVVESSGSKLEGIPTVEGFEFSEVHLHETLPVEEKELFSLILNATQLLQRNELAAERIAFDEKQNITLYMSDYENVRVYMGDSEYLADKMSLLKDISPQLEGLAGVLYLNTYSPGLGRDSYTFKSD